MKRYINRLMVAGAAILTLASCDDNAWNDDLPGFEESRPQDVQKINYTLTAADYKLIANSSTNKALAGDALAADLAAVGTQCYFTDKIDPLDYIPALLSDPQFPYFALSNRSAIKVTYQTMGEQPEQVTGIMNAPKYTVSEQDYKDAWDNGENYANSFAPSCPAVNNIPNILKKAYPAAQEGQYVIVNYNNASVDPAVGEKLFELTSLLGSAATGQNLTVNGYVSALDTQGFILTDNTGSIYCYRGNGFNDGSVKIGTQLTMAGTIASRNKSIQFGNAATMEIKGDQQVTYPAPKTFTAAELDAMVGQTTIPSCTYVAMTGKISITTSGTRTNTNLIIDGANTAQGSPSYCLPEIQSQLVNGSTVTVYGYWYAVAGNRYCSLCVTSVGAPSKSRAAAGSRALEVASEKENTVYYFDGNAWSAPSDMTMLNHADYQAMGQSRDNLSGTAPETLIPAYLRLKFPYAQANDVKFVTFAYYNGSATVTRCARCIFNGTDWTGGFNGANYVTSQFVKKDGKWNYSPDVEITLPAGRGIEISTLYFQACVDWVKNNVPDGSAYITSYGNNDYYTGASAYQGNVDLRPASAKAQYAGYASMTDEEVVALMKTRFEKEVFPAVLAELHPDAAPTPKGIEPEYTINFYYYDGTAKPATILYKVTGVAKFEFVSCTWNN